LSNLDLIIGCHEGKLNGVCAPISSNLAKGKSLVLGRNMSGFEELTPVDPFVRSTPRDLKDARLVDGGKKRRTVAPKWAGRTMVE
jgi:hypothetical protein